MRIQGIEAENFKLFTTNFHKIKDISNTEMVLFNGPNGYGKTSVFDIIEFCLTGEIKRIIDYSNDLAISKNEKFDNKILVSDETKNSYVKLYLEDNGKNIELCYFYNPVERKKGGSKENNPFNIFGCFTRTIIFDGEEVQDQETFLNNYKFTDIKDLFDKCCFLSQDEHLKFLKTTKKSKAEALSFLFKIPEEWKLRQDRVNEQLDILSNRRKKTCYIVKLENEKEKIDSNIEKYKIKMQNLDQKPQVIYHRLFSEKDIFWDRENIKFEEVTYNNAQKELENLLYFAEHKSECLDYVFNNKYKKLLKDFNGDKNITFEQYPLEYAYRFINLIKHTEELEEKYEIEQKARMILKNIKEKRYEDLNWSFIQKENLLVNNDIEIIKEQLNIISNLRQVQGILQSTMTALGQSRDELINNANVAMEVGGIIDNKCPLCGACYSDRGELEEKIKKETELLSDLSDDSVKKINDIKNQIYNTYIKKLENDIQLMLQNVVSEEVYNNLQNAKNYRVDILELENVLKKIGVTLNGEENESLFDGYNKVLSSIKEKLKPIFDEVELQLEGRKFIDAYERFYGKDEQKFISADIRGLEDKKLYIESLNFNFYANELEKEEKKQQKIQHKIDKLNEIIAELQNYQIALKEGIMEYKRKIISDIEPLLHIYTAKILQQKFNGKSIYIHTSENVEDIQFVNSTTDNQDILYSMSSGQLSAVALAFLLCMNQVYGAHKACSILLIDDPVQTIDDVNMVGLVDILRYGFSDRQIFISTHEQSFEWFLRYRYSKAGKSVKVFNMKDIML